MSIRVFNTPVAPLNNISGLSFRHARGAFFNPLEAGKLLPESSAVKGRRADVGPPTPASFVLCRFD
ncbi:MAG: hypothetical protein ACLFVK_04365 [Dehalococcoidia bacterium]